ncbi:MAG: efflux RND transporter periplasmic adaptor subunit [Desulfococcaceae bacterium]
MIRRKYTGASLLSIIVSLFGFLAHVPAQDSLLIQPARKMITLSGYTRSGTVMTLSSEVSGRILKIHYDVGQTVGDKAFFEIDPIFIDFQIRSTRQSLQKIEAAMLKNASGVAYLEKEFRRIDQLHKGDRATEVKRDAAEEELSQAKLERKTLDAEKAVLQTALSELQERKRRHSIFAPKGWIVIKKMAEAGELVAAGTPVAMLGDFRQLTVPLSVSGQELDSIRSFGDEFEANLEGKTVKARVKWVNPEFDEKTRKLGIELILSGYEGEKRGGLRFSLDLESETEGLWIPKEAVINRYDNPRVILKENGETVNIMVLGESDGYLIVSKDKKLKIGAELEIAR